jgi:hypothetical protein
MPLLVRKSNEICSILIENENQIFELLQKESIEVYKYLITNFRATENVTQNEVFKFIFRSYYRLDNAGLTNEFKSEYFSIMQEYRSLDTITNDTILSIAKRLDYFHTKREVKSFQFSFITKLLNTINTNTPIWDKEVRKVFRFSNLPPNSNRFSLENRVTIACEQLDYIKKTLEEIISSDTLHQVIVNLDNRYNTQDLNIYKKIDFLLWSAGKIL